MKRILILGAGEMQLPVIKKSKQLGLYTIVADFDKSAPGLSLADEYSLISTVDFEKVLNFAIQKKIDGILTTSDFPVNIVAKVANILGLQSMSTEVAELCTNKFLQRTFFQENKIKTPFFKQINSIEDLNSFTSFPYIVKPIDSSASRGVKKVNNLDELKSQIEIALTYSKQSKVIVEDFIDGKEFSVESFTQNGVTTITAITEKLTKGEDLGFFVEDTHIIPARISNYEKELITSEVQKAIKVMKLNNCPAHTEVKLNENGVFIVEMACRLGGDYITSDLVPLSTGIDMLENLLKLSLGESLNLHEKWQKFAAIQFFNNTNYKTCIDFINTSNSAIVRSEIKQFHNREITSSFDRMGYVIISADSNEKMNEILNQINN